MPLSVSNAIASVVLPKLICSSYTQVRRYNVLENSYVNGESQRLALTTSSRKFWQITRALTPALTDELIAFYLTQRGPLIPFFLYDGYETSPVRFAYDSTGAATSGRFTVHFSTALVIAFSAPRHSAQFEIEELA